MLYCSHFRRSAEIRVQLALFVGLLLLIAPRWAHAKTFTVATDLAGEDLHWREIDSPVQVLAPIAVPVGATLVIDAGVQVKFGAATELLVEGALEVNGQADKVVRFDAIDDLWYGLFIPGGNADMQHFVVSGTNIGITSADTTLHLEHGRFENNNNALLVYFGGLIGDALVFDGGSAGVLALNAEPILQLTNSIFYGQTSVAFSSSISEFGGVQEISNCTFHDIHNLTGNAKAIVAVDSTGTTGSVLVRNSSVSDADIGLVGTDNISDLQVRFSNVWNVSELQQNLVAFSNLTFFNPSFVNAAAGDFRLRENSALVDIGQPGTSATHDFDGVSRPRINGYDVGAYELRSICGNGIREGDEGCDDGNFNGQYSHCAADCSGPGARCGDGVVDATHEACDDGNPFNDDACLNTCVSARCGDGYVQVGVEACDDENTNDGDGCNSDCRPPGCGNGILDNGEECDDGNDSNEDTCLTICRVPFCGDGYVNTAEEECDDGNISNRDRCLNSCRIATCGDGIVNGEEACDDGNLRDDDTCSNTCEVLSVTPPPDPTPPSTTGCQVGEVSNNLDLIVGLYLLFLCWTLTRRRGILRDSCTNTRRWPGRRVRCLRTR